MTDEIKHIVWFDDLRRGDVPRVGGKNASLGEMVGNLSAQGVRVPPGFATTADAYRRFIDANGLLQIIRGALDEFDAHKVSLAEAGASIRRAILRGEWPADIADAIRSAYGALCRLAAQENVDVAVRSSATAEDLADASFAGQQETYLNVRGERALLDACRRCYASLFTDRAISYRAEKGFDHLQVALSIGVQRMVRSDLGGAGVMFSLDTETGFDKVVLISAAWGLGENVVQGTVDSDEYEVFKPLLGEPSLTPIIGKTLGEKAYKMIYARDGDAPTRNVPTSKAERVAFVLSDPEILTLARWACVIEAHYGQPMDIEWAKDGASGELFVVQARPETVQSRREASAVKTYRIGKTGRRLLSGTSVGEAVATGSVCVIDSARDIARFVDGAILVTQTTDPDWVPIMRRAAAIITDHGGRTSHAAIVSRELGLPAIVGTGNASHVLHDQQEVTVSCAEGGEGFVYEGIAEYEIEEIDFNGIPATRTQVMLNLANPAAAFRWWRIPADGIGLARMEFVISNHIKVHPMALARYEGLKDEEARQAIAALTAGYEDKTAYFVDRLARGLARIAAACHPDPVIVRMSDFKTSEYAHLIGGAQFEPQEENPMLGFRGASRYYSPRYRDGFALECRAIVRLRNEMGFGNVIVMIPFCRSTKEADRVLEALSENGLKRGDAGLEVYVMCEIPSNVILAKAFAKRFDGFSIGSNDLTQLTLGVDRDSAELAELFDEQDDAVKWMIASVIEAAHEAGAKVGLCGQAPSDHPEFAAFLVACGIDSISVSPDSFIAVKRRVAAAERDVEDEQAGHAPEAGAARVGPARTGK
ncbi:MULTISPECIES: phosphoenolpyruvate synthase [Burkholderia]|uniref:phosphoenolpyruvate synthase n=1 Tax=Burkholderia TaxID=32008 RepID=UPI00075571E2|nr:MULTISPECIES: phosphoenolpyruvate synthase [Burkholderia]AOJ73395.1 phosphoenolpyruvate synthase [Burkholderia savannae]KVG48266.1 phosphoenolpyruvate synthase [Burkholderia sp. MSMB0265]KVG84343.1 phosphoenolpyruvate synthase [Burkholderia sp. MSMB2040]KVG92157.1 phosphoenolpyruvate synthase [Burkholderia sp. MSMB2042]KVG93920.1 phosphoenolpyruvate synthase [Burkholderia sp. MSMB2041]